MNRESRKRMLFERKLIIIAILAAGLIARRLFGGNPVMMIVALVVAVAGICTLVERLSDRK